VSIKFLQQKPRFKTLAFTALASLAACSSNSNIQDSDTDLGMLSPDEGETYSSFEDDQDTGSSKKIGGHDFGFGNRRAPQIATSPFQAQDRWMNSFYLVRSPNETWESLSELIYGRPDRADMIARWNQDGTLKVGRVIYYNSALRPDDSASMKVLAEDFGLGMQEVEVVAGDSLSEIGLRLYGDLQTWKEIAVLNPQIAQPDLIVPGQRLLVQPAQLNTRAILEQLLVQAAASTAVPETPSSFDNSDNTTSAETAQLDQREREAVAQVDETPTEPVTASSSGSIFSAGLLTKVAVGLGAIATLALLFIRWRNNKLAQQNDPWAHSIDPHTPATTDESKVTKLNQSGL